MVSVTVDIGGHPCRSILGSAQAQTVEAQAELVVILTLAILAACIHLAEQQLPIVASLAIVPVHGHTAAKVLNDDAAILTAGHVDGIAVAVAGFVDGVGDDLKDGVGAASTPSEPKITAGRLRTRSAPFKEVMLSLPYSCFFAMLLLPARPFLQKAGVCSQIIKRLCPFLTII